jgi:E3 ubiquitin-protein ligase MARCH6
MLFLPLSLGVCLDIATLELFQESWNDRIAYAGKDLFASVFLHWVVGITFMLLVTVSVLQLREVVHPDILARVIRPQEPQPDLLGNLLKETGSTHTKRILMSLGIYAALLGVHIWIPSRLLLYYKMSKYLPIFRPKFWHIFMPQIQIPLELFVFHLCMLGFLEKYKNNIGEIQHHWLILIGNMLRMTDQILPREVDQFVLLGTFPVFAKDSSINQFDTSVEEKRAKVIDNLEDDIYPLWNKLLSEGDALKREDLLQSNIGRLEPPQVTLKARGELHRNGKLLLSSHTYIRFPTAFSSPKFVKSSDKESNLLPTAIGKYRLRQKKSRRKVYIEVWREVAGKLIPRPPEGWDDLGVGGAERQGRWAWGDEQLSEIENSVATRTPFFDNNDKSRWSTSCTWFILLLKTTILLLISWMAITVSVCVGINMPLYAGHYVLDVLRVSPDYVHDPLAFAIGVGLIVPVIALSTKLSNASNNGFKGVPGLLLSWIRSFKPNQSQEKTKTLLLFLILWFGICPMLLGFLYRAFFLIDVTSIGIGTTDVHSISADWRTGTLLLNVWAFICYFRLLTIDVWVRMVAAEGQGNANANANGGGANPNRNIQVQSANDGEHNNSSWQGEDGIISCGVKSIMTFATGWEWDKLDNKALLQDSTLPIVRHLAISSFVPWAVATFLSHAGVVLTSTIYRLMIAVTILIDFVSSNRESLQRWFEAAHKIARDDRYLIGEILLNYAPGSFATA